MIWISNGIPIETTDDYMISITYNEYDNDIYNTLPKLIKD